MLLQFEFLTEKGRRDLVARQNEGIEWLRSFLPALIEKLPEVIGRIDQVTNRARPTMADARPSELDTLFVDGKRVCVENVQGRVEDLIEMAAALSAAGWTHAREGMTLWTPPGGDGRVKWLTDLAYARMRGKARPFDGFDPEDVALNRDGWYGCADHATFEDCSLRCTARFHASPPEHPDPGSAGPGIDGIPDHIR